MESDFGFDMYNHTGGDDDDWVQSYENYYDNEDYYNEGNSGTSYDDECKYGQSAIESLEELLCSDKIVHSSSSLSNTHKKKSKKDKKSKRADDKLSHDRPRKRKRSKFKSGVEIFLNEVLSWNLRDLLSDCRATLRLPRMVLPSLVYNNFSEFSTVVEQVAVEESRVAILQGCRQPEDLIFLDLCEVPPSRKNGDCLIPIRFFVRKGGGDLIKPGWIFCLFPLLSEESTLANPSRRGESKQQRHLRQIALKSQLHRRIFPSHCEGDEKSFGGVLATLALGRHSFQNPSSGLALWVHADTLYHSLYPRVPQQHFCTYDDSMPTQWVAFAIENIITHQRIASSCYDTPIFPFLSKFLGPKESTHIVFESDDDSDNNNIRNDANRAMDCNVKNGTSRLNEKALNEDPHLFNKEMQDNVEENDRDDLTDGSSVHCSPGMLVEPRQVDISSLDSSQRASLMGTLTRLERGRSLELVQGPPGCGKTYFLIHLLMTLIHEKNKRVLVCAPSNKAISVIVEQYRIKSWSEWKDDMIVSIGVEDKFDKCTQTNDLQIDMSNGVHNSDAMKVKLIELWSQCDCRGKIHSDRTYPMAKRNNKSISQSPSPHPLLPDLLTQPLARIISPNNILDALVYKYSENIASVINYFSISFTTCVKYFVSSQLDPDACQTCVKSVVKAVLNALSGGYFDMIDTLQASIGDFFKVYVEIVDGCKIVKVSAELIHTNIYNAIKHLSQAFDLVWSCTDQSKCAEFSCHIEQANNDIADQFKLFHKIFESSENSDYVAKELLAKARVVCSTLSTAGCGLMKRNSDSFDILLVDEAGQCLEGELLIPCLLNPSSLVLIGDPQQLPATVLSMEVQEKLLGQSSMQRLMMSAQQTQKVTGYHLLSTQYRMHPDICSFPNCQYYDSKLNTAGSILDRKSVIPETCWLQKRPVMFVDLKCDENTGSLVTKSRYNVMEAKMIFELLQDLRTDWLKNLPKRPIEIGIITFYSAQVTLINQYLCNWPKNDILRIRVMSVDGFQGSEADIIILSFVRSNKNGSVGFLKDFQRLNVALTRAKHHLSMFGDADTLKNSDCKDLQDLIAEMKTRELLFNSSDFNM